jgi:membrane-associated phospholipid phosphatase
VRYFVRSKSFRTTILSLALVFFSKGTHGQETQASLPDAPVATTSPSPSSSQQDVEVTWKQLPKRFLADQKDIWLFPTQLARGRHWIPTLAVVGGTAGLIVADPHVMPYFRDHAGNLDDFNDVVDGPITSAMIAVVPVTFLVVGYWRHDNYAKSTALLAGEAYANSAVVDLVIKAITRRERPIDVAATNSFHGTFFSGGKSPFKGSAFPSGHAAGAFAVAAVISHRYRQHRWVPWAMYGFATVISLSRVSTLAHFPSDVFLGAALGYATTRFTVLRH